MAQIKVWIQVEPAHNLPTQIHMQLNEKTIKQLKAPLIHPVLLRFGSIRKEVRIMDTPSSQDYLKLSKELAHELGLSSGDTLHIQYQPIINELSLGPVFGVLTDQTYQRHENGWFGVNTSFFEEVAKAARESGTFVYIFTPDGVDLQNRRVKGWRNVNKQWIATRLPLPDCIHNRLTSRKLEMSDKIQTLMNQIAKHTRIPMFNQRFLDKAEVTKLLSDGSHQSLLPDTVINRDVASIVSMFQKYPVIFVKPTKGSLGKGIMRFTKTAGGWRCIINSMNGPVYRSFRRSSDIVNFLRPRLRRSTFLIQRGIPLIHILGSTVDFRALLQKDGKGQWTITSIVARIASSQKSIVSNVAQGGRMSKVKEALESSNLPNHHIPSVQNELRNAALKIADVLDKKADGLFAELGIDLGVDPSGKVWLIEVNSKPSKTEDSSLMEGKIRPSVRRLLSYVHFLTHFHSDKK
jgi:glutathione synthase/RimK-type ligase-like ATP-grasp enzyme